MKISQKEKLAIKDRLSIYVEHAGSQNKAAVKLEVSNATLSQIKNNNWELIKDEMWRRIGSEIGYNSSNWVVVKTRDFKIVSALLNDAQQNSNVFAIIGPSGSGKSTALSSYANSNEHVYLLKCAEFWNRKYFLSEILTEMGIDSAGYTVADMMTDIVKNLKKKSSPLLILDEADKLSDQVLRFFITIYNQLEDSCGIVMCATNHLKKMIDRGCRNNRKGFREIYSRIGRRFQVLKGVGSMDVRAICIANDITEKKDIKEIYDDCEDDLRRVKIKVHAHKMIENQKQQVQ